MGEINLPPFTLDGVYYLESQNPSMNPIAIRPGVSPPDYISWEDTSNGRILHASKILLDGQELVNKPSALPNRIEIISSSGETYKLIKLTKQIFENKLKTSVAGGDKLHFQNDQEIQEYFLKTNFEGN
jgi:hypothetical protein